MSIPVISTTERCIITAYEINPLRGERLHGLFHEADAAIVCHCGASGKVDDQVAE